MSYQNKRNCICMLFMYKRDSRNTVSGVTNMMWYYTKAIESLGVG
uniref:Uncharacterized protein n=1 Tax=Anguilla anguilla TaxID=7936 RepID=A0A0E9QSI6_ANGAN